MYHLFNIQINNMHTAIEECSTEPKASKKIFNREKNEQSEAYISLSSLCMTQLLFFGPEKRSEQLNNCMHHRRNRREGSFHSVETVKER